MNIKSFPLIINFITLFFVLPFLLNAQADFKKEFKINHKGEADISQINQLIKERNYQVVSAFDTVSRSPILIYALYLKNNKFGILNIQGKEITPAIYDDIPALNRDYTYSISGFKKYFTVVKNGKYGVINPQGKLLIPLKYEHIGYTSYKYAGIKNPSGDQDASIFEARLHNRIYFLDAHNKILKPSTLSNNERVDVDNGKAQPRKTPKKITPHGRIVRTFSKGFQSISKEENGKVVFGLYNSRSEKLIIPPSYLKVKEGIDHHFIVQNKEEKYGIVDSMGRTVLKFQYDRIENMIRTHYGVFKNKKMALYSRSFKPLTKFVYESTSSSNAHYFSLYKNGKLGVVTTEGKEITDFHFDRVKFYRRDHQKPLIIATRDRRKGIVDSLGNVLLDFTHELLLPSDKTKTEGLSLQASGDFTGTTNAEFFFFKKEKKYGIYDHQFRVVLQDCDNIIKSRVKDLIYIAQRKEGKRKWGVYNLRTRQMVLPIEMENRIRYFRGGYFNFDKYFSGGFFSAKKNGTYGLYDEYGKNWLSHKVANQFKVTLIYNGLIKVEDSNGIFYMDVYGRRTKKKSK